MALCFLLFTGCDALPLPGVVTVSPETQTAPAETLTPLQPVSPFATASPVPGLVPATPTVQPSATPTQMVAPVSTLRVLPRYVLEVLMDYDTQTLAVQEQIDYPNTSSQTLDEIVLAVQPNSLPGVFELKSLSLDGIPVTDYTLTGQKLTVKLATPLESGKAVKLECAYQLTLPKVEQGDPNVIRPQIFGVTARQVNLTDWYPMVVPYQPGSGWILHDPWFYGEHLVYPLANFDVSLRFSDPRTAPVVAASAAAGALEGGGAHYLLENGRDFAFSMGRQMVNTAIEKPGITIFSYYYPGNEAAGSAALEATVKAVETYSALFGPYPHKTLTVVQGDFNDGMEFDGLYFLSNSFYNLYDQTEKNYLVMVAAHETCHQWWFGRVANDQSQHPWLDESLATYCEKLFYEKNYPNSLTWWWDYRINFYQPEGKIDGNVSSYGGFTPYTNATYRQGARFLEELRTTIGDEAFFNFLLDYSLQMEGQIATPTDFFRLLRVHTKIDLSTLIAKYFTNPY
jgi:hypothetical protein